MPRTLAVFLLCGLPSICFGQLPPNANLRVWPDGRREIFIPPRPGDSPIRNYPTLNLGGTTVHSFHREDGSGAVLPRIVAPPSASAPMPLLSTPAVPLAQPVYAVPSTSNTSKPYFKLCSHRDGGVGQRVTICVDQAGNAIAP